LVSTLDFCLAFVILATLSAVTGLLLTAVRPTFRFLLSREIEPTSDWLNRYDFSRYSALAGLLHPRDFEFLRTQPGYTPELSARLRADRLKIAECYLSQLERDVRLLLNFANHALVVSGEDRDGLSAFLLKQELSFAAKLAFLRAEIGLMKLGLLHQVSFDGLLESLRPLVLQSRVLALPS
jgi:hypothetical protein